MKTIKSLLALSVILTIITLTTLCGQGIDEGSYTLKLLTTGNESPMIKDVTIKSRGKSLSISIYDLLAPKTAEIVVSASGEYKFQVTEIKNKGLVTTQFIGSLSVTGNITGRFNSTVDGIFREDMSGSFSLKKNEEAIITQKQIGGHFGIVHTFFTWQDAVFSGILDSDYEYSVGFPMGITVKKANDLAFDLEFVPIITFIQGGNQENDSSQDKIDLLIHPGLLWGLSKNMTFGTRLAFAVGDYGRYGFTPLLNYGNIFPNGFVEIVIPVRFSSDQPMSISFGIHLGIGF